MELGSSSRVSSLWQDLVIDNVFQILIFAERYQAQNYTTYNPVGVQNSLYTSSMAMSIHILYL